MRRNTPQLDLHRADLCCLTLVLREPQVLALPQQGLSFHNKGMCAMLVASSSDHRSGCAQLRCKRR